MNLTRQKMLHVLKFHFNKSKNRKTIYLWNTYLGIKTYFVGKVSKKIIITNIKRAVTSCEKESVVGICMYVGNALFPF